MRARALLAPALGLLLLAGALAPARAEDPPAAWTSAWARVDGIAVLRTEVAADVARGVPLPHAIERRVTVALMHANLLREGVDPARLPASELEGALAEAREALAPQGGLDAFLERAGQTLEQFREALRVPTAFRNYLRARISEDDLRAFFAQETLQLRVRHVLVRASPTRDAAAARARAEELLKGLGESPREADFLRLVAESDDPMAALSGGDLDWLTRAPHPSVPPEVIAAAFARGEPGLVGEPVRSTAGYHLLWVTGVRRPASASFERMREPLLAALEQRRAGELLRAWRERTPVAYAPDAPRVGGGAPEPAAPREPGAPGGARDGGRPDR